MAARKSRPAGAVLWKVLEAVGNAGPGGMLLGEIAAATGESNVLLAAVLRQYVMAGRLAVDGARPYKRYRLGPRPIDGCVSAPVVDGSGRATAIAALHTLMAALGVSPEDLQPAQVRPIPSAAPQLVTPPQSAGVVAPVQKLSKAARKQARKPAAEPRPRSAALPKTPGPKPVERKPFTHPAVPPKSLSKAEVVMPEGLQVTQLPSGRDTRFVAEPGSFGGGFVAEWQRLRGGAA